MKCSQIITGNIEHAAFFVKKICKKLDCKLFQLGKYVLIYAYCC